jgi:glyoxylase-like metal-dependent hydrolase (beta-lactamase superfamily II)
VAGAQTPSVGVDELADGVYLFTYNVHRSLFVVTDEGVLATDPQSAEAAARYVEEIRRITSAPIKYLVYSHHHGDHVSGGDAFPDDTTVIAHRAAVPFVDADEGIRSVDLVISEDAAVSMDGLLISLVYPGPSETDSNLIVHIPDRGVAFMVDAVSVRTVPWRNMAGSDPRSWKAAVEHLATLDFDILAPGHGPVGTKEHVTEYVAYLDDLINAVQQGIDRGESREQIQSSLELPQYADWTRYDEHFKLNIEGVYRGLSGR